MIVEDDHMQRQMLTTLLERKLEFKSCAAQHGREALEMLNSGYHETIKLIILDVDMPVMDGIETLEILAQKYPAIPVIMLTGSHDIQDAVKAMKLGATDFLSKPYEGDRMMVTVKNALKMSTLSKEVLRLKSEKQGTLTFDNLIGKDGGLASVINTGRKAAASDIPVLITGETGTGKEVFAHAIHGESDRNGKAFIAVNCGAIPAQLVESTLFGHEKGAFTGATEKVAGKFREAEGGTIFLDEVGELPLDTQVKLLRVLQQKEVEPVGAGKPVSVNVRIISATNRDLEEEIKNGHFREDLYFRLNVLQMHLPPLSERRDDISILAEHFIERFCANEGGIPKPLSENLRQHLIAHDWPGNVRQLENTINRAMVMSDGNALEVDDFSALFSGQPATSQSPGSSSSEVIHIRSANGDFKTADELEQEAIQLALKYFDHNITKASEALGIAKSTFYKKLKRD